jgi:hypothetical protein
MPKMAFLVGRHNSLVCYDVNRNQLIDDDSVWKPSHLHLSSICSYRRSGTGSKRDMFINKLIAKYYKRPDGTFHGNEDWWWLGGHQVAA